MNNYTTKYLIYKNIKFIFLGLIDEDYENQDDIDDEDNIYNILKTIEKTKSYRLFQNEDDFYKYAIIRDMLLLDYDDDYEEKKHNDIFFQENLFGELNNYNKIIFIYDYILENDTVKDIKDKIYYNCNEYIDFPLDIIYQKLIIIYENDLAIVTDNKRDSYTYLNQYNYKTLKFLKLQLIFDKFLNNKIKIKKDKNNFSIKLEEKDTLKNSEIISSYNNIKLNQVIIKKTNLKSSEHYKKLFKKSLLDFYIFNSNHKNKELNIIQIDKKDIKNPIVLYFNNNILVNKENLSKFLPINKIDNLDSNTINNIFLKIFNKFNLNNKYFYIRFFDNLNYDNINKILLNKWNNLDEFNKKILVDTKNLSDIFKEVPIYNKNFKINLHLKYYIGNYPINYKISNNGSIEKELKDNKYFVKINNSFDFVNNSNFIIKKVNSDNDENDRLLYIPFNNNNINKYIIINLIINNKKQLNINLKFYSEIKNNIKINNLNKLLNDIYQNKIFKKINEYKSTSKTILKQNKLINLFHKINLNNLKENIMLEIFKIKEIIVNKVNHIYLVKNIFFINDEVIYKNDEILNKGIIKNYVIDNNKIFYKIYNNITKSFDKNIDTSSILRKVKYNEYLNSKYKD